MWVSQGAADQHIRWIRKLGLGFLLAGVFVPFELLVVSAMVGTGVYICIRFVLYLRQRLSAL
jgi:hypothetical protein